MFLRTFLDWLRHRVRLRTWHPDHAWGRRGEDLAHRYLQRLGYVVIERNYRTLSAAGEVDLIGWDGEALAFIEVKTRHSDEYGSGERAVDKEKRRRLAIAARDYSRRAGIDWEKARFDFVNVLLGERHRIELTRDAFPREAGSRAQAL